MKPTENPAQSGTFFSGNRLSPRSAEINLISSIPALVTAGVMAAGLVTLTQRFRRQNAHSA
ncbi:MAG: hypothetical protein DVS81_08575 [Candidatus Accumulibacter meliphilus]|uniref:Uncharacterized protein n=1 Tax=Candidatus Accumulibacter meliphilus TaxID=2211374 RepID=A0A369XLR2_9PROT|nr:MAG: hypothetical protein DVS81_08575 [Candidatus Accumulibacter meliphilus]